LKAKLKHVLPDMNRLYRTRQLLHQDGSPSGVFIKLVLVADKPFIRHVCGMLSHNADAFGAPFCTCCDRAPSPDPEEKCPECDEEDEPEDDGACASDHARASPRRLAAGIRLEGGRLGEASAD